MMETTETTLAKEKQSVVWTLLLKNKRTPPLPTEDPLFVDADPHKFAVVLNWLRL